ncbi:hypothetical protein VJ923_07185 [Adlercreutzia sp. R25]|uniref:hypothetical protein n=1 Tax=Adlercreutzia shanghongiae TaxID=3111773 RepID=UPI002DBF740C|nr:hypothetical protein [Adlercreutzia sp. R25]MEC4272937.1 hypothetical protein [Adlercreutzia sp. R25]
MCEYCENGKQLEIDRFATSDELFDVSALIEGADLGDPVITVFADGAPIYIRMRYCPMCGRDLREADHG